MLKFWISKIDRWCFQCFGIDWWPTRGLASCKVLTD